MPKPTAEQQEIAFLRDLVTRQNETIQRLSGAVADHLAGPRLDAPATPGEPPDIRGSLERQSRRITPNLWLRTPERLRARSAAPPESVAATPTSEPS